MIKKLGLFSILVLCLVFQNCGRVDQQGSLLTEPTILDFDQTFDYDYDKAPVVYGQIQFASKSAKKKFEDVAVIAVMGKSDGTTGVFDYDLSMENENGFPVCPSNSGRLTAGGTSVIDGCVSQTVSKQVIVKLKVTLIEGTKRTVFNFQKKY